MHWTAIDTETELILPGLLVPPLVCLSYADGGTAGVTLHTETVAQFRAYAASGMGFVLHNAPYDLAVLIEHDETLLDLVIDLLEAGRIVDTGIVEQLLLIREGKLYSNPRPSLASLAAKYLNVDLAKGEDTWRLRYGELRDVPIEDWPQEAIDYARDDAETTLRVWNAQGAGEHGCADLRLQVCSATALHVMAAWGVRTDVEAVAELEIALLESTLKHRDALLEAGILKWKHKTKKVATSRDMKVIKSLVEDALGTSTPRTAKGAVQTSDDVLAEVPDENIQRLREYQIDNKLLGTFIPVLAQGATVPINSRYTLVTSGRTSCSKPNLQQLPRKGGVRECFVPRDGWLFASADWSTIELAGLAQVLLHLFGSSRMADAINAGMDLHCDMAADIVGVSYKEAFAERKGKYADDRQMAKAANFGFPGGLGAATFVQFAKGYGVEISEEHAKWLKQLWLRKYPEMQRYFEYISTITGDMGSKKIEQLYSGRVRGDVGFCDGANTFFQGLVADAARHTLWELFKTCYADRSAMLYGCRPVVFIHDEIIMEVPDDENAGQRADALANMMVQCAEVWMPDVKVAAEPVLMRRWHKNAETVRDAQGNLQIWEA